MDNLGHYLAAAMGQPESTLNEDNTYTHTFRPNTPIDTEWRDDLAQVELTFEYAKDTSVVKATVKGQKEVARRVAERLAKALPPEAS